MTRRVAARVGARQPIGFFGRVLTENRHSSRAPSTHSDDDASLNRHNVSALAWRSGRVIDFEGSDRGFPSLIIVNGFALLFFFWPEKGNLRCRDGAVARFPSDARGLSLV